MKPHPTPTPLAAVCLALLATLTGSATALDNTEHELTSVDGKVIKAKVIRLTDADVKISKSGREFDVPLDKFSAETREYLKKWALENTDFRFDVTLKPIKLEGDGDYASNGYDVKVENRSGITVEDITIRYQIYNSKGHMSQESVQAGDIGPKGAFEFKTITGASTYKGRLAAADTGIESGSRGMHLGGLWLRVYDAAGRMIFEDDGVKVRVEDKSWFEGRGGRR